MVIVWRLGFLNIILFSRNLWKRNICHFRIIWICFFKLVKVFVCIVAPEAVNSRIEIVKLINSSVLILLYMIKKWKLSCNGLFILQKSHFCNLQKWLYHNIYFFVPNALNRGRHEEKKVLYASQCASSRRWRLQPPPLQRGKYLQLLHFGSILRLSLINRLAFSLSAIAFSSVELMLPRSHSSVQ